MGSPGVVDREKGYRYRGLQLELEDPSTSQRKDRKCPSYSISLSIMMPTLLLWVNVGKGW